MIPPSYKNTEPKGQAPMENNNSEIMAEIRSMKKELVDDMRELGTKIETIANGHNDLRISFAQSSAVQETKVAKVEKDLSALWESNRIMLAEISTCKNGLDSHKAAEESAKITKKTTGDWVRWIPGVLFGLLAAGIAIAGKI